MKSNGTPAFNFAVCVDDYLMKISHVIRGEDHLSNTPKHILVFEALGAEKIPEFAHMSMTLSSEGQRLSKRYKASSIADFREKGYLPEALINYMVLLGWSPKSNKEILSLDEIISKFKIEDMTKSSCLFDIDKLNWINGYYIRNTDLDRVTQYSIKYLQEHDFLPGHITQSKFNWVKTIVKAVRDHLDNLSQITDYVNVYFEEDIEYSEEAKQLLAEETASKVLKVFLNEIAKLKDLNEESFKQLIKEIKDKTGAKGKDLYMPIRVTLTGKTHGPELVSIFPILGKKKIVKRTKKALKVNEATA
jgi:nondiscriminating glutamyl-tRNA synthetase